MVVHPGLQALPAHAVAIPLAILQSVLEENERHVLLTPQRAQSGRPATGDHQRHIAIRLFAEHERLKLHDVADAQRQTHIHVVDDAAAHAPVDVREVGQHGLNNTNDREEVSVRPLWARVLNWVPHHGQRDQSADPENQTREPIPGRILARRNHDILLLRRNMVPEPPVLEDCAEDTTPSYIFRRQPIFALHNLYLFRINILFYFKNFILNHFISSLVLLQTPEPERIYFLFHTRSIISTLLQDFRRG